MKTRIPKAASAKVSTQWIVGKRVDLAAFIGGALAGYMVFFMHAGLGWDMLLIYVLFITFLDTPHFFGTYLRTYLDRQEFRVRRRFLLLSLLWLVSGPFVLLICYGLYAAGVGQLHGPVRGFCPGRGHLGLLARGPPALRIHAPVPREKRRDLADGPPPRRPPHAPGPAPALRRFCPPPSGEPPGFRPSGKVPPMPSFHDLGGWSGLLSGSWYGRVSWEHFVIAGCTVALVGLIGAFIVRQVGKYRRGETLNLPKILLFTAVLPLHIIVCYSAAVLTAPLVTFSAFLTIYHDIQYHVLVYCHQQNRFRDEAIARESGIAAKLSRNVLVFAGSAIAFGLLVRGFGCSIQVYNGAQCFTPTLIGKVHLFGSVSTDTLLGAFFLGFPCHHYFVDQFIWKPSRDKGLRRDLKLDSVAGAVGSVVRILAASLVLKSFMRYRSSA